MCNHQRMVNDPQAFSPAPSVSIPGVFPFPSCAEYQKKGDFVALNFLEQLVAEWYEFRGYFVRRKIGVGPCVNKKFEFELDIVAFHPGKRHLVHIEPSMDAASWDRREKLYTAKFGAGRKYLPSLFSGFDLSEIDQIALLVFAGRLRLPTLGGGKVLLIQDFMNEIRFDFGVGACCAVGSQQGYSRTVCDPTKPTIRDKLLDNCVTSNRQPQCAGTQWLFAIRTATGVTAVLARAVIPRRCN